MKTPRLKINIFVLITFSAISLLSPLTPAQQLCGNVFSNLLIPKKKELIPAAPSHQSQGNIAKQIVSHLEGNVKALFHTSGFRSEAELIEAARTTDKRAGRLYRMATGILKEERIRIGTRLPEEIRSNIANEGFLNLHETKKSQGALSDRNPIEASYSAMSPEAWSKIPDNIKPKYAALYPAEGSQLQSPTSLDHYTGGDRYYFKMENIRDRATLTPGDSLNRYIGEFGIWESTWSVIKPTSWDQMFVPWSMRSLFIPVVAEGLKHQKIGLPEIPEEVLKMQYEANKMDYGSQPFIVGEGNLKNYQMKWGPNSDYIEVQIWGKLSLDDVSAFEFVGSPPSGQFLRELQSRNIRIIDGRKK